MNILSSLQKLFKQEDLSFEEMRSTMEEIMEGECTGAQIGGFLTALHIKGETVDEITAAATTLRSKALKVPVQSAKIIDTCGTGGDHSGSFNISTTSAIVAAAAGAKVAKHGNKAMSSSCGSANVLQELGLNLDLTPEQVAQSVDSCGIGFLFAMKHHGAMRHVGPARQELKQRTIFNLLGPLLNPAGAKRQVMGVFDPELVSPIAEVHQNLGAEHVLVVSGENGFDEFSLTGITHVAELKAGQINTYTLTPENIKSMGLTPCSIEDLKGGSVEDNAKIIRDVFESSNDTSKQLVAKQDVVSLNAGAALYVAGITNSIANGVRLARDTMQSGKAKAKLQEFIAFSKTLQNEIEQK